MEGGRILIYYGHENRNASSRTFLNNNRVQFVSTMYTPELILCSMKINVYRIRWLHVSEMVFDIKNDLVRTHAAHTRFKHFQNNIVIHYKLIPKRFVWLSCFVVFQKLKEPQLLAHVAFAISVVLNFTIKYTLVCSFSYLLLIKKCSYKMLEFMMFSSVHLYYLLQKLHFHSSDRVVF